MNDTLTLSEILALYRDPDNIDHELVEPSDDLFSPERIARQMQDGVKKGQLWIATDEEHDMYVLIVDVDADDPRMAQIIPLSTDLRAETDDSLVIEQGSPLGEPMVAWPHIPAYIPVRVLIRPLKEFKPATVDAILADDPSLADPHDRLRRGVDSPKKDDMFVENREDTIAVLLQWRALCDKLPKLHDDEGDVEEKPRHSKEELEAYSNALKTVLHMLPGQRLAVSRGMALTPEQQRLMTEAGFPQSPYESHVSSDYLIEAEQPRWREVADILAATNATADPRESLARKAQFELAARVNGHGISAIRGALHKAADEIEAAANQAAHQVTTPAAD